MKNPFSRKKDKGIPKVQVPRSIKEIQAAYDQTRLKAGQAQYQVFVYQEELKQLNLDLLNINREASERQRLDKEAEKVAKVAADKALPAAAGEASQKAN